MSTNSLTGHRVIEMGSYISSPYAGHMLANLGAEVIKVEPFEGDPTRKLFHGEPGGTFIAYSHGKQSVCMDLTKPPGREAFGRLLQSASIFVHNLAPDAAKKLKVEAAECHAANPELVYCHITGYGKGPREHQKATNPMIEAATGAMFEHQVDGKPTRIGPSYLDMFAGSKAVIGILASLLNSEAKQNRTVYVSLYETGLYVAGRDLVTEQLEEIATKEGNAKPSASEFGHPGYASYQTSDGRWIFLLMLSDTHWKKFCNAMRIPLARDLEKLADRQEKRDLVESIVTEAMKAIDFEEASSRLELGGCDFAEVRPSSTVLDDVQARVPGKCASVKIALGELRIPVFPVLSESPSASIDLSVPGLGEHTFEVLRSLDFSADDCAALQLVDAVSGPAPGD